MLKSLRVFALPLLVALLALALAAPCWAVLPTTEVYLYLSNPDGTFPAAVPVAYARVTSTTSTNPWVVGTIWRGTYTPATGRVTWVLPQNCQASFQVPIAPVTGTYSFGTSPNYTLNTMLAVTPTLAPGWAGPLAPFLAVPAKGTLMVSTGTAWAPLGPGTDGYYLTPASLSATGLSWEAPAWFSSQGGTITGSIHPQPTFTYDLGGPSTRWRLIYANSVRLSTDGGNASSVRLYDDKGAETVTLDGLAKTVTCWGVSVSGAVGNVPAISSGTTAPSTTPLKVGDIYVDTTAKKLYFATGTDSSADWTIAN